MKQKPGGQKQLSNSESSAEANAPQGSCNWGGKKSPATDFARRRFLKMAGGSLLATSVGRPATFMAGPFSAADTKKGHLVPADKRLDENWVKKLFQRGEKETFTGDCLRRTGMPCCGIGSGQLYLCGDGTLGSWEIFNNAKSKWVGNTHSTYSHTDIAHPVDQGFAVYAGGNGGRPVLKRLRRADFKKVNFCGEYPIGTVTYSEDGFPLRVTMEAFSPFIPGHAQASSLPATVFNITLENRSKESVSGGVTGWLENPVCFDYGSKYPGRRKTEIIQQGGSRLILHSAEEPPKEEKEAREKVRPAILFEDFEGDSYGNWKAGGEAFGEKPAEGTLPNQQSVSGFKGKGLVNTFLRGDKTQGTLTSPAFPVKREFINFLIGGGAHSGKTCLNLVVDGKTVRTATGHNNEMLRWRNWNVEGLQGKEARLVIVDKASGGWGHINVDQIEFADRPRSDEPVSMKSAPDFGTIVLLCNGEARTANPESGMIPEGEKQAYLAEGERTYDIGQTLRGILCTKAKTLRPGAKHTFSFVLAWHFPNQPHGHEYAARFDNAVSVARHVAENYEEFTQDTRLWRDTYYDSSLPFWLLDRLHSTVSYLATGTAQWWKNGRFWAYEGVTCCAGTCTHVWNYAHGHARLFPAIGRSVREMQDFNPRKNGGGFHPDTGLVGFRSNDSYAADGQCGTILKAYREHLMSPGNTFLKRNWPSIKKALKYSMSRDSNADGLIEDSQHNTYDINYYGANTFVGSLYLAALHAGEQMAREAGDTKFAKQAKSLYEVGRKLTMERLYNGEYFIQDVDLEKRPKHQYAEGCLSDQLFGQGWAHQLALGYIYPGEKVKSALRAVWKYNWAPDISPYNEVHKPFRWFISPGQAGLFTCTWPKSEYLPQGTVYKNEVWTGIEYQVAGHMIWEGFLREGLAICRAVHDRYHPELRNPYNEVECGDHYARAMASWGVYLALAGFEYHGPKGHIGFAPRLKPENFKAAFTASEGWGSFEQKRPEKKQVNRIKLKWGKLRLNSIALDTPEKLPARVSCAGKPVGSYASFEGSRVVIKLDREVTVNRGETLEVVLG